VRTSELSVVVKVFLSCVHDRYFVLGCKVDVHVDIIHHITGLSKAGTDPSSHFVGKNLDQKLAMKLTKEFRLTKGGWAYDVLDIEDEALMFTVQLLARHVLRKCRPTKVPTAAMELATSTKEEKPYNWCLYLLNQLMEDCVGTQEHNQPFHYSWLLVLIAFVKWKELKHSEFLPVQNDYKGVHYVNL
jgi:hypothetical protein